MRIAHQAVSVAYQVATLGDETRATCSYRVAAMHFDGPIAIAGTFEDAADLVKRGAAAQLVVPAAYHRIADFYFDSALERVGSLVVTLPTFVVASLADVDWSQPQHLYLHDAVQCLAKRAVLWVPVSATELVESNSIAAARAFSNRRVCITNRWSAEEFGLTKTAPLAADVPMDFVVFAKRSAA